MSKAPVQSTEMKQDKKKATNSWGNLASAGIRLTKHVGLGVGYSYILSWWLPAHSTVIYTACIGFSVLFFGYFDYYKDKHELYKLSDKYTQEMHKHFCKT